jgi:hypothetical protein
MGSPCALRGRASANWHIKREWGRTLLASGSSRRPEEESRVRDLVLILVTIGFFLMAIGYIRGCERLK